MAVVYTSKLRTSNLIFYFSSTIYTMSVLNASKINFWDSSKTMRPCQQNQLNRAQKIKLQVWALMLSKLNSASKTHSKYLVITRQITNFYMKINFWLKFMVFQFIQQSQLMDKSIVEISLDTMFSERFAVVLVQILNHWNVFQNLT